MNQLQLRKCTRNLLEPCEKAEMRSCLSSTSNPSPHILIRFHCTTKWSAYNQVASSRWTQPKSWIGFNVGTPATQRETDSNVRSVRKAVRQLVASRHNTIIYAGEKSPPYMNIKLAWRSNDPKHSSHCFACRAASLHFWRSLSIPFETLAINQTSDVFLAHQNSQKALCMNTPWTLCTSLIFTKECAQSTGYITVEQSYRNIDPLYGTS